MLDKIFNVVFFPVMVLGVAIANTMWAVFSVIERIKDRHQQKGGDNEA